MPYELYYGQAFRAAVNMFASRWKRPAPIMPMSRERARHGRDDAADSGAQRHAAVRPAVSQERESS